MRFLQVPRSSLVHSEMVLIVTAPPHTALTTRRLGLSAFTPEPSSSWISVWSGALSLRNVFHRHSSYVSPTASLWNDGTPPMVRYSFRQSMSSKLGCSSLHAPIGSGFSVRNYFQTHIPVCSSFMTTGATSYLSGGRSHFLKRISDFV